MNQFWLFRIKIAALAVIFHILYKDFLLLHKVLYLQATQIHLYTYNPNISLFLANNTPPIFYNLEFLVVQSVLPCHSRLVGIPQRFSRILRSLYYEGKFAHLVYL